MKAITEIEHTADRAFSVRGRNLCELFENAARAIFGTQQPLPSAFVNISHEVKVEGVDRETLLVNWLNELLYQQERHQETFNNCSVLDLSETAIRATVSGKSGLQGNPVKAVTFNDLTIQPTGHGFRTTFVVDV
jgi:SHS2 domain-containing protein